MSTKRGKAKGPTAQKPRDHGSLHRRSSTAGQTTSEYTEVPDDANEAMPSPLQTPRRRRKRIHVSPSKKGKYVRVKSALNSELLQISAIRQLAISAGGLVNDHLRKKAWPLLVELDMEDIPPKPDAQVLKEHRDYTQVLLDVERSLKRFPPGMEDDKRLALQDKLVDLILRVLVRHPELHYYQGYHDICVTFLLAVGEDTAFAVVDKLSTTHLRAFMDATMERTKVVMNYLNPIVAKANPELEKFLQRSDVGTMFCLSWLITWYGHVLNEYRHIVRLYDFFIACHPLMPIYLAAAIVLHREKEILCCQCEMANVHQLLSRIPDDLPFEQLISKAGDLFLQYPPTELICDSAAANAAAVRDATQAALKFAAEKKAREALAIRRQNRKMALRVTVVAISAVLAGYFYSTLDVSACWEAWFHS